ncbi:AMP phosphorylase [Candidatus Methanoperedens nitroreducens]|uniref:AMP phosphorylase n=1 Tax=Candidatus Methanoperedens nitratireducens TaxID=1392998 RepID=A0A062V9H7_9EURY|nr:AMP phosphorylase [Candidatus Methanoperedens nitroreducens]KCZ72000.1 AMP phosphorylase [Candidatus Methanoperedens nitroreducens]MDJ1422024.1 AMP phosphorylase [Candidatus Methanoperedens sp.]
MELKVQPLRIKAGKYKIVLNPEDAKELGVRSGDRVQLKDHSYLTAIVETGDMIAKGDVGVYQECCERLGKVCPLVINIVPTSKPSSISFIKKMMDNQKLTQEEIYQIIQDIVRENLTDIEMAAFVTTSYIHGMSADEIEWLTRAMIDTGEKIEFDTHPIVDKHSIGGVPGNKISLLVVPIIAANDLLIPKTSSRAITGAAGTADLMGVLAPVELSADEIKYITERVGGVIAWGGATNIAPADDKLIRSEYPLSIDPRSQLLASIIAKKGAVGADYVVIDLPTGIGTKIPTADEGKRLARDLIELGERLGISVECAMTYGASPVGRTVGPAIEVREALKVLETMQGPNSLIEKSTGLAGILLEMVGVATRGHGKELAMETLRSGKALTKLKEIIEAQGGNPNITHTDIKPGEYRGELLSPVDGYVIEFDNKRIVEIARAAGSPIDIGAGVWINKKKGELVKKGEPLITIFADKDWKLTNALKSAEKEYPMIVEGMVLEHIRPLQVL